MTWLSKNEIRTSCFTRDGSVSFRQRCSRVKTDPAHENPNQLNRQALATGCASTTVAPVTGTMMVALIAALGPVF